MADLKLNLVLGNHTGRFKALFDGRVKPDGIELAPSTMDIDQLFWRIPNKDDVDVCELSLTGYMWGIQHGKAWTAIPVFPGWVFSCHTETLVNRDAGIDRPEDLKGKRIGVPEYQLTANVWARAILEEDHGVTPSDVIWVRGGIEDADRPEKITLNLPKDVRLEDAPGGKTISALLDEGAIDGFIAPRPPGGAAAHNPNVGWLYSDPVAAAKDYFARTRIFPIMHLVGIRRALVEQHPWLPAAVLKGFEQAKAKALELLFDTSATKVTMPFVEERLKEARALMGDDFWSYGLEPNRKTLETFLRHHHKQGLSSRLVTPDELFHPSTHETFKI